MSKKTTLEDVNAVINAKKVEHQTVGLQSGETVFVENAPTVPFQQRIESFSGKKLTSDFVCVRNGKETRFPAGTAWEEIPAIYKIGFQKIDFPADIFK